MIRFSNGDMFESGAEALVNVPRDANPKIEVNHLYTIKKWHAKQESIQEILYWSHGASRYQDDLYASRLKELNDTPYLLQESGRILLNFKSIS